MSYRPDLVSFGQGGASGPALWQQGAVTSDGGAPFTVLLRTRAIAPAGDSGECVFQMAHLTLRASMSAVLRVTPLFDEEIDDAVAATTELGVVETVPTLVTLAQEEATADGYARRTRTVSVPLIRRLLDAGGMERKRWNPRGARAALKVESVGALGVGELAFDAVEWELSVIRRAKYAAVQSG